MPKKVENMTLEELEDHVAGLDDETLMEEWTEFGESVREVRPKLQAFSREHQRRERKAEMVRRLGPMTEEDLALLQEIGPVGIESEESVNGG